MYKTQLSPTARSKDNKFHAQYQKTFRAFYERPKTMLMVSIETGILRANICRYVAEMERSNRIEKVETGVCPASKHKAGFYTTNPNYFVNVEPSNIACHE
jgi:hypothetical protein